MPKPYHPHHHGDLIQYPGSVSLWRVLLVTAAGEVTACCVRSERWQVGQERRIARPECYRRVEEPLLPESTNE